MREMIRLTLFGRKTTLENGISIRIIKKLTSRILYAQKIFLTQSKRDPAIQNGTINFSPFLRDKKYGYRRIKINK